MYLVLIQSAVTALTGARLRWHKLRRAGTAAATAPASVAVPAAARVPAAGPDPRRRDTLSSRNRAAWRGYRPDPYADTPAQHDQDFLLPSKRGILP